MTAGTVFDRSRIPLMEWFAAAWHMTNQKHGVSALGLQRLLGLGSYQTAWTMLQKLRTAMVRPGRDRLHGPVEVDEAYVGGIEQGVRGRGTKDKFIVANASRYCRPRLRPYTHGAGRRCLRRQLGSLCLGRSRTWRGGAHGRLEGLQRSVRTMVQGTISSTLSLMAGSFCVAAT